MKVRCIRTELTSEEAVRLGAPWNSASIDLSLVEGRTYLAYSLYVNQGVSCVRLESDTGYLYPVPLVLFEIADSRPSRYWEVRLREGQLELAPPLLFTDFFFDDLAEGVAAVKAAFQELSSIMQLE
jgi:hypothetical protein